MSSRIDAQIQACRETIDTLRGMLPAIESAAQGLVEVLKGGGKVLTAGNGGSAAEAMHMAEELLGRFRGNRRSLPGIALTADGTVLTCIGNDFGYDDLFRRQVEGLGQPGDLLVLFSSSGRSLNLLRAAAEAKARGMRVMTLLGRDGGALAGVADYELIIPGSATERIQEGHVFLLHVLLDAVESAFPA